MSDFLLHPELMHFIPLTAGFATTMLNKRAEEASVQTSPDTDITVAIRTLNEADKLEALLQDVQAQRFAGEVEVIIVDNESSDHTVAVANFYDAKVVNLPRGEFTYPRSMNMAMEASSHEVVFLTVGHVLLSNTVLLHAGARHFVESTTGGAFARYLPNANASRIERLISVGNILYLKAAHEVTKASSGVMGATNAMFSRSAWAELGRFDESYESGNEDNAMAKQMLKAGYRIIEEPALAVHHAHGLSVRNYYKQVRRWMGGAQPLDIQQLATSRPDLNLE